ncbi:hypothetical protein EA58_06545 [Photobacterium galatheae]|uniref:Uncharacterized protein n=2 Tax=Photobacterium galatheae TaxID=1654360 RepID=A0A066RYA9_9GAMM|nr:hypothetical protein EA58_06545 [Photobacterium galatheae]
MTMLLLSAFKVSAEPMTTPTAVPKNLHVYDLQGNTYVDLKAHGCSNTRYYLSPTHPKYDAITSILLTAQTASKPVIIRYEGCNPQNQGNIIGVYLP